MTQHKARLRDAWESDVAMIGPWCSIPSPLAVEALAVSGFDWLIFDTQHGLINNQDYAALVPAATNAGVPVIIRVTWNEPGSIMKALDAGAEGVIVPMVNSPDEARRAVAACRFPPAGIRSWGPLRHVLHKQDYTPQTADRDTICIVMIETVEAVERADEILAVPGIDGVLVGPSDLGVSAGFAPSGKPTDPGHLRLIETALDACLRHGVVAGIACGDVAYARRWREAGFRMLAVPSDVDLIRSGSRTMLEEFSSR